MKIIYVTYTTTAEYAAQNQLNIQKVMDALSDPMYQGINYNACVCADGVTFMHYAFFKSAEDQALLGTVQAFKDFQMRLKESGLVSPPKQQELTLVGASQPVFHN
jgi:hypothetical protein